jgi:predicted deacylase
VAAPFVVVRGAQPGPVVGISAAIHGDELNGIKIIHHVLERVDPRDMHGSLVCAPVANVPAFQAGQRRFPEDDLDLNHVFPGKWEGKPAEQYAKALLTTFLTPCDYLIDIHTASEGRINSLYVRADLHQEEAREMALLLDPQIILHGRSGDGTLRNAARLRDIPAITVEAGNPMVFQGRVVLEGEQGVFNILIHRGVIRGEQIRKEGPPPVICKSSKWLRTRAGGLLETGFQLCDRVTKRQDLATVSDPFGYPVESYGAPHDGIVIGMSRNPVAVPGTRFCHLGQIGEPPPRRRTGQFDASELRQPAPKPGAEGPP